jgi:hypothetical protein
MADEEQKKSGEGEEAAKGGQEGERGDKGFDEILQEIRILQQGAQVLTAFLTILPFNQGFERVDEAGKWVFLATFLSSLSALAFFSAPAAQHRLARPIKNREAFKGVATGMIITGLVFMALALTLSTHLVVTQVFGRTSALIAASTVTLLLAIIWFILPLVRRKEL